LGKQDQHKQEDKIMPGYMYGKKMMKKKSPTKKKVRRKKK
jgi:hypothetical protein